MCAAGCVQICKCTSPTVAWWHSCCPNSRSALKRTEVMQHSSHLTRPKLVLWLLICFLLREGTSVSLSSDVHIQQFVGENKNSGFVSVYASSLHHCSPLTLLWWDNHMNKMQPVAHYKPYYSLINIINTPNRARHSSQVPPSSFYSFQLGPCSSVPPIPQHEKNSTSNKAWFQCVGELQV